MLRRRPRSVAAQTRFAKAEAQARTFPSGREAARVRARRSRTFSPRLLARASSWGASSWGSAPYLRPRLILQVSSSHLMRRTHLKAGYPAGDGGGGGIRRVGAEPAGLADWGWVRGTWAWAEKVCRGGCGFVWAGIQQQHQAASCTIMQPASPAAIFSSSEAQSNVVYLVHGWGGEGGYDKQIAYQSRCVTDAASKDR
jgi:hypothetical protein